MGKWLLWTITLIGLVPSAYLVMATAYLLNKLQRSPGIARYRGSMFIHDMYVCIGPMNVTVFPRIWAMALIVGGIGVVFIGMMFLLHVPVETS